MDTARISKANRQQINDFISSHWFSTDIVVRGEIIDMTFIDGFAIFDHTGIIGLITFRMMDHECEIMSFDSLRENQGIGTALLILINLLKEDFIMDKWEYTTVKVELKGFAGGILDINKFNAELNNLGNDGWELISCFATTGGQGYGREAIAVFKRKK